MLSITTPEYQEIPHCVRDNAHLLRCLSEEERSELLEIPALLDSIQMYQKPTDQSAIFHAFLIAIDRELAEEVRQKYVSTLRLLR